MAVVVGGGGCYCCLIVIMVVVGWMVCFVYYIREDFFIEYCWIEIVKIVFFTMYLILHCIQSNNVVFYSKDLYNEIICMYVKSAEECNLLYCIKGNEYINAFFSLCDITHSCMLSAEKGWMKKRVGERNT